MDSKTGMFLNAAVDEFHLRLFRLDRVDDTDNAEALGSPDKSVSGFGIRMWQAARLSESVLCPSSIQISDLTLVYL